MLAPNVFAMEPSAMEQITCSLKWFLIPHLFNWCRMLHPKAGPGPLLPPTLSRCSIGPGASGFSHQLIEIQLWHPNLLIKAPLLLTGVGCVWNLSMALFGTGVRMASLVSRITASVAIVKAGGTVSGTILAGSRGEYPWKAPKWGVRGLLWRCNILP